jgi:hypothetical protein
MEDDWVATHAYEVINNSLRQARAPSQGDPHVEVDRFGDNLPRRLYSHKFLKKLQKYCATKTGKKSRDKQAERLYCNTVAYVEEYVRKKFPGYE